MTVNVHRSGAWWRRVPMRLWWGIGMVLGALLLGAIGQNTSSDPPPMYDQWQAQQTEEHQP